MSNYSSLKATIDANVRTNNNQEITGAIMNSVLNAVVTSIGAKYQYAGVATPTTNPNSPDQNLFYIATTPGTYTYFSNIVVAAGECVVLKGTGTSWTKEDTGIDLVSVSQNTLSIGSEEVGELAGELIENPEWVKVVTDSEDKILYGVKTDGKFYFGDGCPPQVAEYIQDKINELSLDEYEDIVAFLGDLIDGDTLATLLNAKLDKEGLDADALESIKTIENPEYIQVTTDNENKILEGITSEGVKQINLPIDTPSASVESIENPEWLSVDTDKEGRILGGRKSDGSKEEYLPVTFKKATIGELELSDESIDSLKQAITANITLEDIDNGTPRVYLQTQNVLGNISQYGGSYDQANDCINFKNPSANNYWIYSEPFNPLGEKLVHIRFRLEQIDTNNPIKVCISKNAQDNPFVVGTASINGEYDITFDATYYRVYHEFTQTFYVWFYADNVTINAKIYSIDVFELKSDSVNTTNIDGLNAKELFESTDNCFSNIKTQLNNPSSLVAPNGNRYEVVVNNEGQIIAIPVIPDKVAFFGNSLVWSNYNGAAQFGMCALSSDADFVARINSYISSINQNYSSRRFRIFEWEIISDANDIDPVIDTMVAQLTGDENLVVLEGGDNVPTTSVETILPTSSIKLLRAIRTKCPNARICWLGIWYNSPRKYQIIESACKLTGCTLIPIYDLNTLNNQCPIGEIIDYGAVGTEVWTIERVSNLVDNGNNNITFTFTYLSVTKTVTIDVTEYTYSGTTLTYKGRYQVVTIGYSHPGNRGMSAIANRMLYTMGISDNEEVYNLN